MKMEDFETAKVIIAAIGKIEAALDQVDVALNEIEEFKDHSCAKLSEYDDGSGWRINLKGILPSTDYIEAIEKLLHTQRDTLKVQLEEI